MEQYILHIVEFVSIFMIGYVFGKHILASRLRNSPDQAIKELQQYINSKKETKPSSTATTLKVEQANDQYYLFTKDTDQFVGQGTTLEQAIDAARQRFPNKQFQFEQE